MDLRGKSGGGLNVKKYKCDFGHVTRRLTKAGTNFLRCSKIVFSKGKPMTCDRKCERYE